MLNGGFNCCQYVLYKFFPFLSDVIVFSDVPDLSCLFIY